MNQLLLLSCCVLVASLAEAKTRYYRWNVSRNVQIVGDRTLTVNVINGRVKAPAIFVEQGDFLSVRVTNGMPDTGLTIHWHGLEMREYQLYDGPVGVMQCHLAPGETFTYKFKVHQNPGTYWYHTHNEMVPVGHDIIRGPLIVVPPGVSLGAHYADPYLYESDNERILFYQDFLPNWASIDHGYTLGGMRDPSGFDAEGVRAAIGKWTGGMLNGGEGSAFMQFENGVYRFRIINANGVTPLYWSIDGYRFKVVATDGSDVEPYEVDALQISLGERYDVEVEFAGAVAHNVWMRAKTPSVDAVEEIKTTLQIRPDTNTKFVEGEAQTERNPDPVLMNCAFYKPTEKCVSVTALKTVSSEFDDRPILEPDVHTAGYRTSQYPAYGYFFSLDGGTYIQNALPGKPMAVPDFDPEKDLSRYTAVMDVDLGKTVILVVRSISGISHPIHVHGHKFEILDLIPRSAPNCKTEPGCTPADLETSFSAPISELAVRKTRGVLKDTVNIPPGGAVVLRFNSDNPGIWFVHCHFEEHVDGGQGFILREGDWKAPYLPKDYPSCDYSGRLQGQEGGTCNCDPDLLDPSWLCSKWYLCKHVN